MAAEAIPPSFLVRAGDLFRALGTMLVYMLLAVLRRSIGRRRRPTWGFGLEVLISGYQGLLSSWSRIGHVRFRYVGDALLAVNPLPAGGIAPRWVRLETASGGLDGAWFEPPGADGPVIYYVHGGGFAFASVRSHASFIGALARSANARAFSLDYRLAPEHRMPAALDDVRAGYLDLLAQRVPPARIVLAGDSSGGNLVLCLLLALREAGEPLPAAAVSISGLTDFSGSGASMKTNAEFDYLQEEHNRLVATEYLAGADPRRPDVSPLFADLRGLPPLLLQAGEAEVLVDQIREFGARAEAAAVDVQLSVYPDMVHVWHIFGSATPLAQQGIDEIGAFVRKHASAAS